MLGLCNLCGFEGDQEVYSSKMRSGDGYTLKCRKCGHIFLHHGMSPQEIVAFNEDVYVKTNSLVSGKELDVREHFLEKLKSVEGELQILKKYLSKEHDIVDIGCGAGSLLYALKDTVKSCSGIEINKRYVDFISNDLGFDGYCGFIEEIEIDKNFDVAISIGAIDHMPYPMDALRKINGILKDGGTVIVEVPNINNALNKYLPHPNRERFNEFFLHSGHFSNFYKETIEYAMREAGFEIVDILFRHQYTLKNYLNWYFTGLPQSTFESATNDRAFFGGNSDFEESMNQGFAELENVFLALMGAKELGDTIVCIAKKPNRS
jgi:SAM-dependent methyltransferase